ncbi:hypothetical protein [Flavobacterium sp.]|uniref:hypothetical protein n=1 Tax=Flavobacterium sp. TaxID=239 RepID=UPI0037516B1B
MSNSIFKILDDKLNRKSLRELSLNNEHRKHSLSVKYLIDSDKKCYHFDKIHTNNSTVDALEYNGNDFYLIEFKDERIYNPKHDWGKIAKIIFKSIQSVNSILELYKDNKFSKIDFYHKNLYFLIVFSSTKSTDLNDFKTLKSHLKEKYGNIFRVDILNEKMFVDEYVNTSKVGI